MDGCAGKPARGQEVPALDNERTASSTLHMIGEDHAEQLDIVRLLSCVCVCVFRR